MKSWYCEYHKWEGPSCPHCASELAARKAATEAGDKWQAVPTHEAGYELDDGTGFRDPGTVYSSHGLAMEECNRRNGKEEPGQPVRVFQLVFHRPGQGDLRAIEIESSWTLAGIAKAVEDGWRPVGEEWGREVVLRIIGEVRP